MKNCLRLLCLVVLCLALVLIWPNQANAASESDLTFTLNSDGQSYSVTGCSKSATGELVIPKTYKGMPVTGIGKYAFSGCTGLTYITIPDSVTSIGDDAFYRCFSLIYNIYDNGKYLGNEENPYFALADTASTSITSCVINKNTKIISSNAFENCTGLTSITIPDSVTSISDCAFYGCYKLTSITIPDSVTSIGSYAFTGCTGLTSITIPDSVTSIGPYAFSSCTGLVYNIYDNGKYLGNEENPYFALAGTASTSITSCVINKNTKIISSNAFENCTGLTSITIPDSVTSIGDYAFFRCTGLTSFTIPDSVTSIGANAFENCVRLTSVTIGDSVTSIGDYAFSSCRGLTSVTIPDSVTGIGAHAFSSCTGLTSVTIPDSVTGIGTYAFRNCTGLTSVTIPDSVISIGNSAFYGCTGLTAITIPDSVTSIGNYAFDKCSSLANIFYSGTRTQWAAITIGSNNNVLLAANLHCNPLMLQENVLLVTEDGEADIVLVAAGQVLDLNGHVLTVNSLASFGQIIDSVGGGGLVATNIEITSNDWLPVQDSTGCYRFYEYEVANLGAKDGADSAAFGFALDFADATAYTTILESDDVQVTVTLAVGGTTKTFAFSREMLHRYAKLQLAFPDMQAAMKLHVTGLDTVADGTVITVTLSITAVGGKIQNSGDAIEYIV